MLELLIKYAKDHGLVTEPGFAPKNVRWAIVLGDNGGFLDVIELGDPDAKRNLGQRFSVCPDLSQPEMVKGGVKRSHFLIESASVVALYGKSASEPKTQDKHLYFKTLLREASETVPELKGIVTLLSDDCSLEAIRERLNDVKAKENDKVTFRIAGTFPLETDAWHDWWRNFRKTIISESGDNKALMRCFATGGLIEPAMTHLKIKGLADVGGIASGDALIGFDKESFRSYGFEQSANAAVSVEATSAYRAALNHLIEEHGQRLAGTKVVHWFQKRVPRDEDPLAWLEEGQSQQELSAQEQAKRMLDDIRMGQRPDLKDNYYYALTLSGASGRVMVRDWMEGQFEELVDNIAGWFDDLAIINRDGNSPAKSPKFFAVLGGMVRDLDDLYPPQVAKLWRAAVNGEIIPRSALAGALSRTKIDIIRDDPFNHARMGLIKAYHLRENRRTGGKRMAEVLKPELDKGFPNPAYQCGRLMAILARLQRSALGDVGAGVVQRYYAAASTTPSLVLGRLTRTSQFHLSKLNPGLANWYEERLTDVWSGLAGGLPKSLNLEEQSLFALGYYQQIADMRAKHGEAANSEEEVHDE